MKFPFISKQGRLGDYQVNVSKLTKKVKKSNIKQEGNEIGICINKTFPDRFQTETELWLWLDFRVGSARMTNEVTFYDEEKKDDITLYAPVIHWELSEDEYTTLFLWYQFRKMKGEIK